MGKNLSPINIQRYKAGRINRISYSELFDRMRTAELKLLEIEKQERLFSKVPYFICSPTVIKTGNGSLMKITVPISYKKSMNITGEKYYMVFMEEMKPAEAKK